MLAKSFTISVGVKDRYNLVEPFKEDYFRAR